MSLDLYYDPVIDEHVGHGPFGIVIPSWYFAPQRSEIGEVGWQTLASMNGLLGDGPITGLNDPESATMFLQLAGELADENTKARIWEAAEDYIEPTWDLESGEFTLGLGLNEKHPRGQLNARIMAGWVCTKGAWSRIFNEPNLTKFDEPTVEGVDFPRIALSVAYWDGKALHIAAHAQNSAIQGTQTTLRITNLASADNWIMTRPGGEGIPLVSKEDHVEVTLVADNQVVEIKQV